MRYAALTHPTQRLGFIKSTILNQTPQARFELATNRLTVDRSTTELLRNALRCESHSTYK